MKSNECLIYSNRLEIPWKTFTMEYGETYSVKERLTEFQEDGANVAMVVPYVYLVVPDVAAFVEPAKDIQNSYGYSVLNYKWLLGFDCGTTEEEIAVNNALFSALMEQKADDHPWDSLSLESREEERFAFYEINGSLFFLGIMLSVVFLMAAVIIIYYKQISEGYEDQSRFEIMQKVGMTKKDIRKSINSQMLTVFFLPLVMAGLHLGFAFPCLSKILKLFAFDNMRLHITVTLVCFDRIISKLYEDNVMGKLSDERFIKMSHDYEREQSNLKSAAEVLRKELKQQEQQKTNAKAFVAAVKKYTDMQELDAAVLREFIDRIEVSHVDRKSKTREITIVYNFIGAFDFTRAIEEAQITSKKQQRTA